jgi:hypothetical protein
MPLNSTKPNSEPEPNSLFKPPSGGDLVLLSSDGIKFPVHSVLLKLASSVFDGMIVVGQTKDLVELSENAATVSLMLRFIYPNEKNPTMTSFDMVFNCLQLARKYDLDAVVKNIDEQIASNFPPHELISSDPMRAHHLAIQFGLYNTKVIAASLVMINRLDVCEPKNISGLLHTHDHASLIRIVALQGA